MLWFVSKVKTLTYRWRNLRKLDIIGNAFVEEASFSIEKGFAFVKGRVTIKVHLPVTKLWSLFEEEVLGHALDVHKLFATRYLNSEATISLVVTDFVNYVVSYIELIVLSRRMNVVNVQCLIHYFS